MAGNDQKAHAASKKEKREIVRERARILREQEAKRQRRNKALMIGGALVALLLVVFAMLQLLGKTGQPNTGTYTGTARPAKIANITDDYGIDVNAQGVAGKSVEGAGVLSVYSDYTCGGCINLESGYAAKYHQHAEAGELSVRLYPVATLNNPISDNATAAMFYVATYAPEQAWAYNDALFERTAKTVKEHASHPTEAEFADIAAKVGVPKDVVNDLPASIAAEDWKGVVKSATEAFRGKNYNATPTLEVNGTVDDSWLKDGNVEAVIQAAIDAGKK
ncbi:DsbA family protein [Trueperella pecoris]|uniref:DsbA family protein n=1 Tax=Trueperella pecoris TaxID=2733571 RepID=UPI001ABDD833|nr:thioredoxin domain-containing protein [Trueperella pecoris]QTG75322.1 thioredoxin domain-containing protein [Trueperella pecoris]